jgi:hypothetical protein
MIIAIHVSFCKIMFLLHPRPILCVFSDAIFHLQFHYFNCEALAGSTFCLAVLVLVERAISHMCCSSARQSHAFDEGIVAWRVISKQILLRP